MRIYCIGGDPNYPCYVLTAKGCTIMLDCALNMKSLQYFLPQMLVPNQRFDSLPNFRSPVSGNQFSNVKEFNNRAFLNSTLEFGLPQFNLINIQDIDAVFISNYSNMLALPYLTRLPEFRATVYCTEPTLHFGRMLMEEMTSFVRNNQTIVRAVRDSDLYLDLPDVADYVSRTKGLLKKLSILTEDKENAAEFAGAATAGEIVTSNAANGKQPKKRHIDQVAGDESKPDDEVDEPELDDDDDEQKQRLLDWKDHKVLMGHVFNLSESYHNKPLHWQPLYDRDDVDKCIAKVKLISFNERVNVFGSLHAQPKSSGYSIGSCNWQIDIAADSILYLSRSNTQPNMHPKPFDSTFLRGQIADCLLLSGLNQVPTTDSDMMIKELCRAAVITVKNQGSVLIPCQPTGKIYDIVEILNAHLGDALLGNIPIYFISSVADQSLAYSNIFAEWLNDSRLNATFAAETPFQHSELVRNGFLKVYRSITGKFNDEFRQPCILFASHPSLRFGEACHFVELWKTSPANSIIFIEPDYNYQDALAPYQPVYANYYYFPIDRNLTPERLYKLLGEAKAINQTVLSNQYNPIVYKPPGLANANKNDQQFCKIDPQRLQCTNISYYFQNDVVKLLIKRKYENCDLDADLAAMIVPIKAASLGNATDLSFATFNAQLVTKNNHHVLKAAPRTIPLNRRDRINESQLKKYAYGKLSLAKFLNAMRAFGLSPSKFNGKDFSSSLEKDLLIEDEYLSSTGRSQQYSIEFDKSNSVDLDLGSNQINIACDNEDIRVKLKDCLLKCLNTL